MPPDTVGLFLLVTGLATAGAVVLFLAPATMTRAIFGQPPADDLALIVARHWGLLVGLVGALLVCAAYRPEPRVPVLIVAIVEKVAFALAMFASPFGRRPAVLALALADAGMAAAYLILLAIPWGPPS